MHKVIRAFEEPRLQELEPEAPSLEQMMQDLTSAVVCPKWGRLFTSEFVACYHLRRH